MGAGGRLNDDAVAGGDSDAEVSSLFVPTGFLDGRIVHGKLCL